MKILQLAAMTAVLFSGLANADGGPPQYVQNYAFTAQNECLIGTQTVTDWNVVTGNVNIYDVNCNNGMDSPFPGLGLLFYADLAGHYAGSGEYKRGTLSQTMTKMDTGQVILEFSYGGNPQWQIPGNTLPNDGPVKAMAVYLNDVLVGVYSVDTSKASSITDAQWQSVMIYTTLTKGTNTITFRSLNGLPEHPTDFGMLVTTVEIVPG